MSRYCIFLKVELESVQKFREKWDPLASKVPPHVTLVHPFETDLGSKLVVEHIQKTFTLSTHEFELAQPEWTEGYALLPVVHAELSSLRQKLYSGILKHFHKPEYPYSPHITIGRYQNAQDQITQQNENHLETRGAFQALILEQILEDETSKILYSHSIVAGGLDETS
jgi:2'-5' RNA ligase